MSASNGKAARKVASRSSHRDWDPPANRPDPRDVLARQDESRVPELVPIRYGRMLASPLAFYRGAAAIMAGDLAATPRSGITVQLCGDAHLSNFGVFAAPDRRLVFDINDFDETLPGPFEWDVKRLAASFSVAGGELGLSAGERREAILAGLAEYRAAIRRFAGMRDLEVWYARFDVESFFERWRSQVTKKRTKVLEKGLAKARHKDSLRALERLSHEVDGVRWIVSAPPLIVPVEELGGFGDPAEIELAVRRLTTEYKKTLNPDRQVIASRYRYHHAAHKVVGVGSVGARAWIVLLLGQDAADPLFLQAKEAQRSVLEPFAGRSRFAHQGRRVVEGQRLIQADSDIFLGWLTSEGLDGKPHDYYVRQLWDGKRSPEIDLMGPLELGRYARMCGWTLARAHARSGDREAIAGYLGAGTAFDQAIADFAEAYADQNERDYQSLLADVKAGRVEAVEGL